MSAHKAVTPPRLLLTALSKRYGATLANAGIELAVAPGEIHALLGENGAGKSTLVKMVCGLVKPDSGGIAWEGAPVPAMTPEVARKLGIAMVFQHFSLFETLTVAENIALGLRTAESIPALSARIRRTAQRYGLAVDPARHVHHLSVGERQRVEIVRCLLQAPRLLIMDEPTSVLTPQEVDGLCATLRRLAAEGCSILYISHKLEEVAALCHAATVLRGGQVVARCDPTVESASAMGELMVGRALPATRRNPTVPGAVRLTVAGLSLPSDEPFGAALHGIGFDLRAGEIMGIAGVAGNGQKELLAALSGERPTVRDTIRLGNADVGGLGPAARRRHGMTFIPEERLGRGAVAELTLAENALLTCYGDGLVQRGMVLRKRVREYASSIFERFGVVAAGIDAEARSLSGGNMQKFIIGREVGFSPRVLLASHPTWGVDIGAALSIRQQLIDLAAAGTAILIVSEDLGELFEVCDRIAVLCAGRLTAPRPARELTARGIGEAMGGMTGRMADAA